jgi:hypothetical protein
MKYIIMVLFLLIPLLCRSQTTQYKIPKNKDLHISINVTGGDLSSDEGSVSYSIGQIYYLSYYGTKNYITEGIQQPDIISITPIDKEEGKGFRVAAYPNPTTNSLTIETSNSINGSLSYQLTDLHGRLLKKARVGKSRANVDVSGLPTAIYLLKISDNGKFIKTIKIIKR